MGPEVLARRGPAGSLVCSVVKDVAQPGGQNQVVVYLRGCLVTTPEYLLAPLGSALKWKVALIVPRLSTSQTQCAQRTHALSTSSTQQRGVGS